MAGTLLRDRDLHPFILMRRRIVAAVWVTGATVPLLGAAVFLAGCCVLPFHAVMHELMPLCETAASVVGGDHPDVAHQQDAVPPSPTREKQEPVRRLVTTLGACGGAIDAPDDARPLPVSASSAFRSFITLGAVRCDQDVGLNVLDSTFLI